MSSQVKTSPRSVVVYDDTILDKHFPRKIEMVRMQFNGNARGLLKSIDLLNYV